MCRGVFLHVLVCARVCILVFGNVMFAGAEGEGRVHGDPRAGGRRQNASNILYLCISSCFLDILMLKYNVDGILRNIFSIYIFVS